MNMPSLNSFKRIDVRPLIAAGEEPLSKIIARLDTLASGEGLLLIAPFLPSPLIEKLQSEGFASKVEHGASGQWMIYFWREAV
jgi:uncharacterized protein (DUF2249 family)